jgi:hypothetical protein
MWDVGCQMADGGWRMSDGGCRMSDVGCQMSDVRCQMSDVGCQMADGGCGDVGMGRRTTETELLTFVRIRAAAITDDHAGTLLNLIGGDSDFHR